ncbi:hypothetical protein [Deinococcus sp.]|uniref:hypothetical protein n=1 Tax=Deinococcus sp. TaxID=47478 RepID=UPI003CC6657A
MAQPLEGAASLTALIAWANAEIVKITRHVSPDMWKRHLGLMLGGLRLSASPLRPAALSSEEIIAAVRQNT